MEKVFRDEIAMLCHETMKDGYRVGIVSDEEMKEFEENCFVYVEEPLEEEVATVLVASN